MESKNKALWVKRHEYRGFSYHRHALFNDRLVLGWFTFTLTRDPLTAQIDRIIDVATDRVARMRKAGL
jgi:hypothetical protein